MSENVYPFFIGGIHANQPLPGDIATTGPLVPNISHVGEPPERYALHSKHFFDAIGDPADTWYYYMAADTTMQEAEQKVDEHRRAIRN